MDSSTLFLLRFFGPVFLVIGCPLRLCRPRYEKMVRALREFTLSYYLAALLAFCTGLVIVLAHNRWGTLPEIAVTAIGWGGLLKGTVRLLAPDMTKAAIDKFISVQLLTVGGVVILAWGGYMTFAGFFA